MTITTGKSLVTGKSLMIVYDLGCDARKTQECPIIRTEELDPTGWMDRNRAHYARREDRTPDKYSPPQWWQILAATL